MKKIDEYYLYRGNVIGRGSERCCYLNLFDRSKCFKVSPIGKSIQTSREIKFFEKILRKGKCYSFLPKYYGSFRSEDIVGYEQECFLEVKNGGVFDRVVSLGEYVADNINDENDIRKKLMILKNQILNSKIVCCDLSTSNIIVARQKGLERFVIIDGLGGTELIPVNSLLGFLRKRKIERQWKKLEARLERWYEMRK